MIRIAFCGDRGVARPIGVAVASVHRAAIDPSLLTIYVVHSDWRDEDLEFVRSCAPRSVVRFLSSPIEGLPPIWGVPHVSPAAYLLFRIPDLLSGEERVLYLDADTLVRADLADLYDADLRGAPVAGAHSHSPFLSSPGAVPQWREWRLDPAAPVINSGVLVMDLERWRDEGIGERATAKAAEGGLADQMALNAVLNGNWTEVDPRYNVTRGVFADDSGHYGLQPAELLDRARADPAVVHFTSLPKPWHYGCDRPFTDEWRSVARNVGWEPWHTRPPVRKRLRQGIEVIGQRVYRAI